jgi:hypothetical protein
MSPPQPDHNSVWYDLNLTAFPNGGTITFQGQMGPSGCNGSSFLLAQCATWAPQEPTTPPLVLATNVPEGAMWSFQYTFAAGTDVLHFGTEGSWGTTGQTNTNAVTVSVQ